MRDSYLLLTPILVLGVLGLVRFVGCEIFLGLKQVGPIFVKSQVLGTARNDYSGFSGMAIDVGSKSLNLRSLGRYCIAGSIGDHRIKIIDANVGTQVGVTIVSLAGRPAGYVSANLAVTLTASKRYYIVSEEVTGGDQFFDNDTVVTTQPDAAVISPVYQDDTGQWVLLGMPGNSYGPVNFEYDEP